MSRTDPDIFLTTTQHPHTCRYTGEWKGHIHRNSKHIFTCSVLYKSPCAWQLITKKKNEIIFINLQREKYLSNHFCYLHKQSVFLYNPRGNLSRWRQLSRLSAPVTIPVNQCKTTSDVEWKTEFTDNSFSTLECMGWQVNFFSNFLLRYVLHCTYVM